MPHQDTIISRTVAVMFAGAGTNHTVQTPTGARYQVIVDGLSDVSFLKSTDGGLNWQAAVAVRAGTVQNLSIWYDRWSGIAAGLIHCAYTDNNHITYYRSIDTENSDALGTETTIFSGVSAVGTGSMLSITRARGGNLYCKTMIDAGAEGGFYRSTDVGATWGARTDIEALATSDQCILLPGFAADDQDIIGIFWDASANEISRVLYDDSGDVWAETSIVSAADNAASSGFPHFAAAVDLPNSQIVLLAWNAIDSANADLLCYTITESAITAKTDVVTNSTDDQALAAIGIATDTGYWYAFYCGKSDGSETFNTVLNVYMKVSKDSGTTWGAETLVSNAANTPKSIFWLATMPRFYGAWAASYYLVSPQSNTVIIIAQPAAFAHARVLLGV